MLMTEKNLRLIVRKELLEEDFKKRLQQFSNYLEKKDDEMDVNSIFSLKKKGAVKGFKFLIDTMEAGTTVSKKVVNALFKGTGAKPFEGVDVYMKGKKYTGIVVQPVIEERTKQIMGYIIKLNVPNPPQENMSSSERTINVIRSSGKVGVRKDPIAKKEWLNKDHIKNNWNERLWKKIGFEKWFKKYMSDVDKGIVAFAAAHSFFGDLKTVASKEAEEAGDMAQELFLDTALPAVGAMADVLSVVAPPFAPALQLIGEATGIVDVTTKLMRKDYVATFFAGIGLVPAVGDFLATSGKVLVSSKTLAQSQAGIAIAEQMVELTEKFLATYGGELLATFENIIKKAIAKKPLKFDEIMPNITKAIESVRNYFKKYNPEKVRRAKYNNKMKKAVAQAKQSIKSKQKKSAGKKEKTAQKSQKALPKPKELSWISVTSVTADEIKGKLKAGESEGKNVTYKKGTKAYNNTIKDLSA